MFNLCHSIMISLLKTFITPFLLLNRKHANRNAAELCLAENKEKKKLTFCICASASAGIWTTASLFSASLQRVMMLSGHLMKTAEPRNRGFRCEWCVLNGNVELH